MLLNYNTTKIRDGIINDYENFFFELRTKKIKYLEIGIFNGGSLYWARDYFKQGEIYGIDIDNKFVSKDEPRIKTFKCSQNETEKLNKIGLDNGKFDIIIDDGSHWAKETKNTFDVMWNYLNDDGWYVIEDWQAGFYKKFKGCDGIQNVITDIMLNKIELNIKSMVVKIDKNGLAFFQKGKSNRKSIFLSPHCDDETLFGAYTIMKEKPLVLIVIDSKEKKDIRIKETLKAMEMLGVKVEFLHIPEEDLSLELLRLKLSKYACDLCYVPAFIEGETEKMIGLKQHNIVSKVATELYENIIYYCSHRGEKRIVGKKEIIPTKEEQELKKRVLKYYQSQINSKYKGLRDLFGDNQKEYYES